MAEPSKSEIFDAPKFGTPPPADYRQAGRWDAIIPQMRQRPGKWAQVGIVASSSTPSSIRKGKSGFTPAGDWQARVVHRADGRHDLWVMFSPRSVRPANQPVIVRAGDGGGGQSSLKSTDEQALCRTCQHANIRHKRLTGPCERTNCTCPRFNGGN